jgi:hypothetical protein
MGEFATQKLIDQPRNLCRISGNLGEMAKWRSGPQTVLN